MSSTASNRRWIFAVLTAVLFPAVALHSTCVAVMGPGTWGSGMQEVPPDFKKPTLTAEKYARAIGSNGQGLAASEKPAPELTAEVQMLGQLKWMHRAGSRIAYLTEDISSHDARQRLYIAESDRIRQLAFPSDHIVVRPQWAGENLIYERWNPWALPASGKVRRYVASWMDPSLRPEAALYESTTEQGGWRFLTPGHSLTVSPDGRYAAFLRSGALLAGYYSIHVWRLGTSQDPAILSLREHDGQGSRSFSLRWSQDSKALRIHGKTGGYSRRGSRGGGGPDGIRVDLLYLTSNRTVYDLNFGS